MQGRGIGALIFAGWVTSLGAFPGCDSSSTSGQDVPDGGIAIDIDAGGGGGEAGSPATGCAPPSGAGTTHQGNIGTESWTAAASPHIIPADTNVTGTLTLEPCAEVLIGAGKTVTVLGSIVANGTAAQGIHIGAKDPSQPFVMIRTAPTTTGPIHLSYVTIDGGGDPSNIVPDVTGTLNLQGTDGSKPTQSTIFVDHVTVSGSKSNGLVLHDGAGFADGSTDLTVKGSALYPVSIWSRASGTLPSGTYTGNGTDEILLPGTAASESFAESTTLHDRGVPYHAGGSNTNGDLVVDPLPAAPAGSVSTLTIEAGVTLRFKKGGVLHVASAQSTNPARAALVAVGTADKPIVFTSAEATPAAGDWLGIYFGDQPLGTDRIDHAKVQYAGGLSSSGSSSCAYPGVARSDAAIRIFGGPGTEFVTNTTIADSGFYGIDRGWRKDDLTDFLPTNTFTNVGQCKQTYPEAATGACPTTVPCP